MPGRTGNRAPRTPITAKLVANLITAAGANRVLTMDLHAAQIQGFFDIPVDNLFSAPLFARDIAERYAGRDLMVVSPDVGGVVRARAIASRLHTDLAIIDKRRPRAGVSEVMNVIGEVEGRHCILVDDIVDSGGTLCNAAEALIKNGASGVSVYVTHGVFSGGAVARVGASPIENMTVTDSILATEAVRVSANIRQVTIAPLLAEAMRRISRRELGVLAVQLSRRSRGAAQETRQETRSEELPARVRPWRRRAAGAMARCPPMDRGHPCGAGGHPGVAGGGRRRGQGEPVTSTPRGGCWFRPGSHGRYGWSLGDRRRHSRIKSTIRE